MRFTIFYDDGTFKVITAKTIEELFFAEIIGSTKSHRIVQISREH